MPRCFELVVISCLGIVLSGCQQDDSGTVEEPTIAARDVSAEPQSPVAEEEVETEEEGGFEQAEPDPENASTGDDAPVGEKLAPGDKAPPLDLAAVVHGSEIRPFTGEHVIVLDFWATWCAPCLRGMPHLSDLQERYGPEVQFIGITDETAELVAELLERSRGEETWADVIRYSLAIDNEEQTFQNFMGAAELRARPKAFIIDRTGTIAWIGNPAKMDETLAAIVAGDWDIQKAREKYFATPLEPLQGSTEGSFPALPLEPGMPAPELQLKAVMHGPQITDQADSGRIQVIEFWATWCRHSLSCIEVLRQAGTLHADSADIIAVSTEDPETVASFLAKPSVVEESWASRITYTVAIDDNQKSWQRFMEATENAQIPSVFIVDGTGRLAWIGHPRDIGQPLEKLISGRFNVQQAAVEYRARRSLAEATRNGVSETTHELLTTLSDSLIDNRWVQMIHLDLLSSQKMYDGYNELAARVIGQHGNDPLAMNTIAWEIAAYQAGGERDLDLAMSAAVLANEYTQQRDGAILDTVARVHYEQGNLTEAVEWQRRAVQVGPYSRELQGTLRKYASELAAARTSSN